jgi:mRNA-degrading endonuclease RelE of RelBE toxin-antitoxin system
MSFNVLVLESFKRRARKLIRKYPSLKEELDRLLEELSKDPTLGTPLGQDCYKIRLRIASKGKGKSGGARVISYVLVKDLSVYLLTIYDKSEQSDVERKELQRLIKEIP